MQDANCKSFRQIAPGARYTAEQLAEFVRQSDECIFMQGACHVMAAELYRFMRARELTLSVASLVEPDSRMFRHYMVGRKDRGLIDVRLLDWHFPEGWDVEWFPEIPQRLEAALEQPLGRNSFCCVESAFMEATSKRAKTFVDAKSARLQALANELR